MVAISSVLIKTLKVNVKTMVNCAYLVISSRRHADASRAPAPMPAGHDSAGRIMSWPPRTLFPCANAIWRIRYAEVIITIVSYCPDLNTTNQHYLHKNVL